MSLSDRIRPNSEAAPWVVEEVKKLEGELLAAHKRITELEASEATHLATRRALEEMYDAMLRYQSDAETEAPAAHRQMMHRTRVALGIEPNARAEVAKADSGQSQAVVS